MSTQEKIINIFAVSFEVVETDADTYRRFPGQRWHKLVKDYWSEGESFKWEPCYLQDAAQMESLYQSRRLKLREKLLLNPEYPQCLRGATQEAKQ